MSEIVNEAWRKYRIQLQFYPLRTKAITAGVLIGLSDGIAQKISGVKKLQLRTVSSVGLRMRPFGHFLHKLMDIIFKGKKDNKTVTKKVLLELLTSSPWNNLFFMLYYGLVVEGMHKSHVLLYLVLGQFLGQYVRQFLLWKTMEFSQDESLKGLSFSQLTAWKFWPIVGWVNYQYMPLQFRVLFHSFIGSCWAIFLNLKARSGVIKQA